ncbi:hypothetical protein EWM64_g204 [Hericium alpestre]|uniref:Sec63-domain-containing protein n=1 Tax=Hericium alpestre TaxID=135208 RepID=A0A4Z0A9T7_9AGAM|nr:hypothetical protein EWM64_g204 [Hericium alpestre]
MEPLGHTAGGLAPEDARRRMEEAFRATASRPLFTAEARAAQEVLPHVYSSTSMTQGTVLSQFGSRYMLPLGTTRTMHETFEEVVIPPSKPIPPRHTERLISVAELDPLAKGSFPGKTDVAMLTILRVLDQHRTAGASQNLAATIRRDEFKIIYVAPMKALASEITRKLGKRLQWLGIRVRELTGDMQLTKAEIAETQIIVTTPEKWDIVTRKPTGEGEIASTVKLLIIDEVHLLNEDRGAVIETIVARTLRQVEYSQSVIRIVGLSATLPNYIDVADFLSVSRQTGLFYFDSSFRPVPLEQHFLGVKGKPNSPQSKKNLDRVTYDKVMELVQQGHQVMVFVHARKETVKTALGLREAALAEGTLEDFSCQDHPQFQFFRRDIGTSRNKEMRQLFDDGFGIHHAGMLRSDRNMMERMFEARSIKVLCCTATLAWGVNLPAHAVIIKGTQVYDSSKGAFVDLSVLDVLQVFGRAGRPGLETSGEGYIATTDDKLDHYLEAVTSQNPIESKFEKGMVDSLNAEISLGTVANVGEGVQWLGYTYLNVRMRKNPLVYGVPRGELADDPHLGKRRRDLTMAAVRKLEAARMINFDRQNEAFSVTDLGRIAAKYYIRHSSIEIFNKEFRPRMTEADVLGMLSMSTEFDQIQVRESEGKELDLIMEQAPCAVKGGPNNAHGKVNILLQGFISRYQPEDFALVSDTGYVAQNAGRIVRALLEIAISRKWANVSTVLMGMSKAIEKRLWPFDQPLRQFELKQDIFYNLERWADDYSVVDLASMTAKDLGDLVHLNERHGKAILDAAKQFPTVEISYNLRPLGPDVLKIATQPTRFVGFANSVNDPADLAAWLDVEPFSLYSFRPSDRDSSLAVTAQTFTIPQSAALFKAMAKPAHAAIRSVPEEPAIVFIPSRGQCRSIALDLITYCTLEMTTENGYLPHGVTPESLEPYVRHLQDPSLGDYIVKGVGFFHEGISKPDRTLMLQLYVEGNIRVLLVPRDACWSLPIRAGVVIVMGTQYIHLAGDGAERQVRDYALDELVRMQGRAVRHGKAGHFFLFCQAEDKDTYMRFLEEGLPLESKLLGSEELRRWYKDQRQNGIIRSRQEAVQALSFTFLARRLVTNPAYYDSSGSRNEGLSRIIDALEDSE